MTLQALTEHASTIGCEIDLAGCDYGPHKRTNQYYAAVPYYFLLAGFVRTLEMRRILEIGTSFGGSIMALDRGAQTDKAGLELVTVDKADFAGEGVKSLQHIRRVIGNSLAPDTLVEVRKHLNPPIDLLYIDSKHSYEHTSRNLEIYGAAFRPKLVILDDIHINEEMDRYWSEVSLKCGEHAFDASHLVNRPSGFGILDLRENGISKGKPLLEILMQHAGK